jgi:transposase, IS30 family
LKRNRINETLYLPDTAQIQMATLRQVSKQLFISVSDATMNEIKQRLELYHSPQKTSGRLEYEGLESVSHETIYQMVYSNHQGLGQYQRCLRQGQRTRRRRKGLYQKQGTMTRWD